MRGVWISCVGVAGALVLTHGCWTTQEHGAAFEPRAAAVIVEGCDLDDQQRGALAAPATRRAVDEVVLWCLQADSAGAVAPAAPASPASVAALAAELRGDGYRVSLALSFADPATGPFAPDVAADRLHDAGWRGLVTAGASALAASADALELAPPRLADRARPDLVALVAELADALPAAARFGLWAPPSLTTPSDIEGGDAFDLAALGPSLDYVRLMTLDFSCCGAGPGPTTDAAWAADVWRHARAQTATELRLTLPLYGMDFGPAGDQWVGHDQALALATYYHARPVRAPGGELRFVYLDGGVHEVWFDDARSAAEALATWDRLGVPGEVGVGFYGLGAEDPAIWDTVARARP